jgi:hypothetical protein
MEGKHFSILRYGFTSQREATRKIHHGSSTIASSILLTLAGLPCWTAGGAAGALDVMRIP